LELAAPPVAVAGPWRLAWRRLRRDRVALGGGILLVALVLAVFPGASIAAALLGHGPNDPFPYAVDTSLKPVGLWTHVPDTHELGPVTSDATIPPAPPGTGTTLFLLGADGPLGRDLFLRVLYGGQVSLEVGFGATIVALALGVFLGVLAGWAGGIVDGAISRLTDLVMALPMLLILLMVGTGLGDSVRAFTFGGLLNRGAVQLILLIGVFTWYYPARIVRAQMLSLRSRDFVEAAGMVGARARASSAATFFHTSSRRWSRTERSWSRRASCSRSASPSSGRGSSCRSRAGGASSSRPGAPY
jgi:peptide/nickel transport system permease protein